MSTGVILLIILVILFAGGIPVGRRYGYGYGPSGIIGLILIVLLILFLLGKI